MQIRLLVAERDEDVEALRALVDEALTEAGVSDAEIEVVPVRSDEEARTLRCLGSPTVRVEGYDVEYAEREPPETSMGARYYSTPSGWQRLPERGMIVFALKEAQARARR
jgi:hypothetical protein